MKKNVLKATMALCLMGLMMINASVLFAGGGPMEDDFTPPDESTGAATNNGWWFAVFAANGMDVASWECKSSSKTPECVKGNTSIEQPF